MPSLRYGKIVRLRFAIAITRTYLKNSLSAHGGVMKRLNMLTY